MNKASNNRLVVFDIYIIKVIKYNIYVLYGGGEKLTEDFISARDRIVSASIDIISDAGLASLTIPIISMRTNINEMMIYKYYSDTDALQPQTSRR